MKGLQLRSLCGVVLCVSIALSVKVANALPSYATQTGMACVQCHVTASGSGLTKEGREFKLDAYADGDKFSIPLSATALASLSHINAQDDSTSANTYRINRKRGIDQGSIYVAGRIVKHLGILAQAVYEDFDHKVHLGDFDLRYGRQVLLHGTSIEWGASLNNNPTVQDLWDSTPAHHEPYVQPHWAPKPVALPVIEGDLTYRVLGVSAHALFDKHYFVELGDYRKLSRDVLKKSGNYSATQTAIGGSIPYWRGAVQFNAGRHYFSGGVFGLRATFRPDKSYYEADVYIDDGVDLNYQFIDKDDNALSVSAMWLRERRNLTASSLAGISDSDTNKLITRRLNVTYAYYRTLNLSATWFDVRGNPNALLYPSSMSANHSPATRGYIAQVEYAPFGQRDSLAHPWLNFSAGLEQIAYQQFAGAKINYDGAGRDAANNDTTVLYVKAAF